MDLVVVDILAEAERTEPGLVVDTAAVAVAAELVLEKIVRTAEDLEAFANHAKRTTINTEDVKLLVRNCPKLVS